MFHIIWQIGKLWHLHLCRSRRCLFLGRGLLLDVDLRVGTVGAALAEFGRQRGTEGLGSTISFLQIQVLSLHKCKKSASCSTISN